MHGYTEPATVKPADRRKRAGRVVSNNEPSNWALVFDCETRVAPDQSLRVGIYQVREGDQLGEEGFFFDPDVASDDDLEALRAYADAHGLKLRTV